MKIPENRRYSGTIRNNSDRARRALQALAFYAEEGWEPGLLIDNDHAHQALGDLLADLRHLATRVGVEFDAANDRGARHYADELLEDLKGDWPYYLKVTT